MDPAPLLAELIRRASDGPDAVLARVEQALADLGFEARRTKGEPRAALLTRGRSSLALSGHVDVVPPGEGWTRDAFGGEVADGRVWGRGACDMLGSVACFVAAAARTRAPCAIILTTDEETGMRGATHALDEGLLEGIDRVVVGEPTSLAVGIAEKGVLWLRIEARGKNAHGSMPELGDNAVLRAVRIVDRLARYRPPGEHPMLGRGTLSVNRLVGGDAVNQVPARATIEVDVRYLPGTTDAELLAVARDALAPEGGLASLHVVSSHVPFETAPDAPLARAALAAVSASGRPARTVALPYGTEASKFAPSGRSVVILGPGDAALAHTSRESIALADLEAGTAAYAALVERAA